MEGDDLYSCLRLVVVVSSNSKLELINNVVAINCAPICLIIFLSCVVDCLLPTAEDEANWFVEQVEPTNQSTDARVRPPPRNHQGSRGERASRG